MRSEHQIKLDAEDVEWLRATYPQASLGWVLSMMLKEFRKQHSVVPADLAKLGAAELKKIMEER
jgi:hypothetical protein